ncbi:metal-dependent hydrolase [Streptomyces sp. S4.7]|uniref:MBL fold metallo-hydrolase n=1 Tax=Streptomyces sp. S4.7 TaxID=2705439 RepID=UPI001396E4AC|nr:MBL fold metallo-hydrolase [Streptomyces sp. S4.7]QHY96017.1 metal-dependent hydrolase [Streptomyces sp. S4.7]
MSLRENNGGTNGESNARKSERRRNLITRRGLLGASAAVGAGVAATAVGTASAGPSARPSAGRAAPPGDLRLRWLGNNGWEIRIGAGDSAATVLIDPWLTRFWTGTYSEAGAAPETPIEVDTAVIDGYGLRADQILVTHGHYDHMTDVPHLAKTTGATVFGTESHVNTMRAMGAPERQLSVVGGGERLQYKGYSVQVVRSLHSMGGEHPRVAFAGTRPGQVPDAPETIADLVEGGSLSYLVSVNGFDIVNFGSSNFSEHDLEGIRADLVMIQPGGANVPGYVPRLLDLLGHPAYVVPTHWDDFDEPLDRPAVDWGGLDALHDAVRKASPKSRFVKLDHLETLSL